MVKGIPVGKIRNIITSEASIVDEDASLLDVAEIMVKDPKTRAVYVVDREKNLKGIISLMTLVEHIFYEYIPEEFSTCLGGYDIIKMMNTKKAKEIMLPVSYVKDDENLKSAFRKMFNNKLNELPVVDNNLKVIGDLNMLEILGVWIKKQEG
jgi:CBS domain-containing protein